MNGDAVATTLAIGLVGLDGHLVEVETHVGRGLVAMTLVGLPDASLREAKERVRSALQSCGVETLDRRTTINLSPAGLPKSGSGFDLAIIASVMVANGLITPAVVAGTVLIGELGLDGSLRAVPGVLPALLAAKRLGITRAMVPNACLEEARLVPGMTVRGFEHLADLVSWAGGKARRPVTLGAGPGDEPKPERPSEPRRAGVAPDMADVRGQAQGRHALEVAAAGGHHLLLSGEPGAGKTMLASRLTTILPDLDDDDAVTVTALHSVVGALDAAAGLIRTPPLQAPHHSVTVAALIGGGSGVPRPGAVSLAHAGVLVLDEAAEFAPSVLDALRQPLEQGVVTIHRARANAQYPAAFQLVLATNPCPCGMGESRVRECTCTSLDKRRYMSRLSGPLLDRVDIRVHMRSPTRAEIALDEPESSLVVRERVLEARQRARRRWAGTPWTLNSQLPGPWLRKNADMSDQLRGAVDGAVDRGVLTLRGADRVLRLSWTLADLKGSNMPNLADLGLALRLRTGASYDFA